MNPSRTFPIVLLASFLLSCFLFACAPEKKTEEKPQGVLTDSQQKTLDKAKQTQEVLDKASQERMKAVDDAAGEKNN